MRVWGGTECGWHAEDRNRGRGKRRVNKHLLRDWQAQFAKISQVDTTSQAVVAIIGDSWVHVSRLIDPLRRLSKRLYGDAGAGLRSCG